LFISIADAAVEAAAAVSAAATVAEFLDEESLVDALN